MTSRIRPEKLLLPCSVRPIEEEELPQLLALCEGNELFYRYESPAPTIESLLRDRQLLPPGKESGDKFFLGLYDGEQLTAVLDLIDGYPDDGTAYIGLFMLATERQGRGEGSALIAELCDSLARCGFSRACLAYRRENPQASHFWKKNGFRPIRELAKEDGVIVEAEKTLFRPLARSRQAMTQEECLTLLTEEKRGVLSLLGDGGYPYGVPMNHWYCPEDGKLYFHGGKQGHRIDAMRRCDKASFCVLDEGQREDGDWPLHFRSVIVFGRLEPVEDAEQTVAISRHICDKFTSDSDYVEDEIRRSAARTFCFALVPEHISGKRVKES